MRIMQSIFAVAVCAAAVAAPVSAKTYLWSFDATVVRAQPAKLLKTTGTVPPAFDLFEGKYSPLRVGATYAGSLAVTIDGAGDGLEDRSGFYSVGGDVTATASIGGVTFSPDFAIDLGVNNDGDGTVTLSSAFFDDMDTFSFFGSGGRLSHVEMFTGSLLDGESDYEVDFDLTNVDRDWVEDVARAVPDVSVVPLPAAFPLVLVALGGLWLVGARRRN